MPTTITLEQLEAEFEKDREALPNFGQGSEPVETKHFVRTNPSSRSLVTSARSLASTMGTTPSAYRAKTARMDILNIFHIFSSHYKVIDITPGYGG
jgi:hypothetical protein